MTTTYRAATSDMFGVILTVWPQLAAIVGYTPEVRWQDVASDQIPDGSKVWARVSRQTIDSPQTSLSTCVGEIGKLRYTEFGLVFVQLFAPAGESQSQDLLAQVAEVIRGSLRRKSTDNAVWFRNARINEIPPENRMLRANVVAEFNYDEIH